MDPEEKISPPHWRTGSPTGSFIFPQENVRDFLHTYQFVY
jgi:hypothetical protein